ncbi:MAG: hypothetical protein QOG50_3169 [Actinomycetota bacterium]|nr:hypothetical protein [Actinomycetota bacterium]
MSRATRLSLRVMIASLVVGALTACGGSSSKSSGGTTSSSASDSSTTKPALTATEPATDPTAAKAALRLADVGAGFRNNRKAGGVTAFGAASCAVIAPGAFLTTRDHLYSGAMFKQKGATYFAYSEVYVFRTAALATRFAAFRTTSAYQKCKQQQDDASTRHARANSYVKLTPMQWSDPTGHIPSMYRELTGITSGGKQVDGGFYDRYTIRRGRVVIVVNIDSALGSNIAASFTLAKQTYDILRSLDAALPTRLAGV